jgi:hypothetical protein
MIINIHDLKKKITNRVKINPYEAVSNVSRFINNNYYEIMISIVLADVFIIGLNHKKWLDILDRRTTQFAAMENGNNGGMWNAIKEICSELEQDHPGITARMIDQFDVGFNAGYGFKQ